MEVQHVRILIRFSLKGHRESCVSLLLWPGGEGTNLRCGTPRFKCLLCPIQNSKVCFGIITLTLDLGFPYLRPVLRLPKCAMRACLPFLTRLPCCDAILFCVKRFVFIFLNVEWEQMLKPWCYYKRELSSCRWLRLLTVSKRPVLHLVVVLPRSDLVKIKQHWIQRWKS